MLVDFLPDAGQLFFYAQNVFETARIFEVGDEALFGDFEVSAARLGVDVLITDDPQRAIRLRGR